MLLLLIFNIIVIIFTMIFTLTCSSSGTLIVKFLGGLTNFGGWSLKSVTQTCNISDTDNNLNAFYVNLIWIIMWPCRTR